MFPQSRFPLLLEDGRRSERAHALCQSWPFERVEQAGDIALVLTAERLELRWFSLDKMGAVAVDFAGGRSDHRRKFGGGEAINKAISVKGEHRPSVLDATAGLGRDSFVMASAGSSVVMLERHPVVAALLEDGLERARFNPEVADIAARMSLIHGDACTLMSVQESGRPAVVFLDPMFPHRQKSAAVKKEMRLFQQLVGADVDSDQLLSQSRQVATRRVVVKRPSGAPYLDGVSPSGSIETKGLRFDIYPPKNE